MIDRIINAHPIFHFLTDLQEICRPLNLLNIQYFAHVNINAHQQFTALCNNARFAEHYYTNHYYNADIHMSEKELGETILWDFVKLGGRSQKMHTEAAQFGINHTFTIIQKHDDRSKNYYHFATHTSNHSMNQIYLQHLDLLKIFILHFNEKIKQSKSLSNAYRLAVRTSDNFSDYCLNEKMDLPDIRSTFIENLAWEKPESFNSFVFDAKLSHQLTLREQECLYHYIYGKTPEQISRILFLSKRTVEQYMETIKIKLNVQNKSELIEKIMSRLYMKK